MNQNVKDRFLTYVSFDTQSDSSSSTVPSTEKQLKLAAYLADELKGLGLHDVEMDQYACVYAHIPASAGCARPGLALIAHMDTAMDMSGADIKPHIVTGYDGGDIVLNQEKNIVTRVSDYPSLAQFKGQDLIVTDGTTLLGADDKAGIAEIVTLAQYLMEHPEHPHPAISILFTPDEEIGRGADHVDVKKLDAAYGYTVDGGILGEFSYENFNAAGAVVTVHGVTAHTGYSKGVLKNAILMAMEYQCLLPVYETPACTEGREGFFHLLSLTGNVEEARMIYLIRDHDSARFAERKAVMEKASEELRRRWGSDCIRLEITDQYPNMAKWLEDKPEIVALAVAAMRLAGVEDPVAVAIRGGTDGSQLTSKGLPCPNLPCGTQYAHGRYEFVSVQALTTCKEMVKHLVSADLVKRVMEENL